MHVFLVNFGRILALGVHKMADLVKIFLLKFKAELRAEGKKDRLLLRMQKSGAM